MGGCLSSSKPDFIPKTDGGEEDFHNLYLEDKLLGEGEFGQVKLVHDMKTNHVCAVKILRKGIVFKDNVVYAPLKPEVLKGEVEMLRTLAGTHYCLKLYGVYETPKFIYLVMELCGGGEMMAYVSQQDDLRTEDVSRIIYQLLDAIDHCVSNNIIHRDVKPENVLFLSNMPASEMRLIDFGSGCMDLEPSPPEVHSTFAGSAFYISPEMFQRTYTSKTDVWSCGVLLYVLVAGYPADELQKAFNIMHKSKNRNLRSLPNMPDNMPDSFYDLLEELLCYRHKGRKSAGELLNHEFVQFHKIHADNPLSLHDVVDDSLSPLADDVSGTVSKSKTTSMRLTSSVQRHSLFMDFKKFERSVTTLLATLLAKPEFDKLLETVQKRITEKEELKDSVAKNLNIIPIHELKAMLKDIKAQKWCVWLS